VIANVSVAIEDLRHPETFAGFVLMATAVITGLLVGASGVLAATRRAPRAARPTAAVAIGVAVACAAFAGIATVSTTSDPRVAGDIVIDVRNMVYPDVTLTAGANVLFIDNHDLVRHTLLIEGTDIAAEIPGTTSRRITVDLAPGTYRYICDVPGHEGMRGTITVTG
jgi:plastocyanin